MSLHSLTGAPTVASVDWRSSQRCMEVNVLLDILLYWWVEQEGGAAMSAVVWGEEMEM